MQKLFDAIKAVCPEMIVMPDVALDPYSIYGHDGIIENGDVENDSTNEALVRWPFHMLPLEPVAPSDMMDGRVLRLRQGLDAAGFHNVES
jgi:porphobilinogen synthase